MASLLSWLGKQAEGAFAQVNPWDNGKTYRSVMDEDERRKRRVPPPRPQQSGGPNRAAVNQGLDAGKSWENIAQQTKTPLEEVREFSKRTRPNYGIPQPKRPNFMEQFGDFAEDANKATFGQAQKAIGDAVVKPVAGALSDPRKLAADTKEFFVKGKDDRNFAENAGELLAGNTARLANTAYSGAVKPIVGLASGRPAAEIQRDINRELYSNKGGLLNAGTFFPTREAYEKTFSNPLELGKKTLGAGLGVGTEVIPFARGASYLAKPGLTNTQKILRSTAEGAAYGAAGSAGQQLVDKGRVDGRKVALGALGGGVLGGAIPAVGAAGKQLSHLPKKVRENTLRNASAGARSGQLSLKDLVSYEGAPDRKRVEFYKQQLRRGKPIEPLYVMRDSKGKLGIEDGKHRFQAMRELGMTRGLAKIVTPEDIRSVAQGGYAQLPDGKSLPAPAPRPSLEGAAQAGVDARALADATGETAVPRRQRLYDFVANNFTDDTGYFQGLDRKAAGRNPLGRMRSVGADERIDPQIQRFRNANSVIDQRTKDLGVEDFARSFPDQKTYDAYQIYRLNRAGLSRAQREKKPGESLDKAYARFTGGRSLAEDNNLVAPLKQDQFFADQFARENAIYGNILRERGQNPNFKITPDEVEQIIKNDPDYAPLNRVIPEDKLQMQRQGAVGSMQGKNVKELAEGSESLPVEDAVTSMRDYVGDFVRKDLGNDVMNTLLRNTPGRFKPVVTAEQLAQKDAIKLILKDFGKEGVELEKQLRRDKKFARRLDTELNRLNRQGVKASLGTTRKTPPERAKRTVTVKTVQPLIKSNAPKKLDDLSQSYAVKASLKKEYGDGANAVQQMAADIHNGGWTQSMALNPNITRATAKSIAGQVMKKPTEKPGYTAIKEGRVGRDPSTKSFVENLVNKKPAELQRILNKITTREPKHKKLAENIQTLANQADDIKAIKAGLMGREELQAFKAKAGENYRRRVVDGYEEIYEVTDPRMAKNLNQLSQNQISQAARVLGVPGRVFRFFTTGTGNIVGFAPIAITRDVLGAVLFSKAPVRATLDPRAYADALKAAFRKGDFFSDLQRRGVGGTMVESQRQARAKSADLLRANNAGKKAAFYAKNPRETLRGIENIDTATERFTRARFASARYRQQLARYKRQGMNADKAKSKALFDAAEEYREAALNFGRGGKVVREANQVIVYLNPAVQAGNKVRRQFLESPLGTSFRLATVGTMISGLWAWNNSSEQRQEVWDRIDEQEKRDNLIIIGPDAKFEKGKATGIWKIPLPHEYRPLTSAINEMYKSTNEADYGQVALNAVTALQGVDVTSLNATMSQLFPTAIKPTAENITNHSFFTGDQLVPEYVKERADGDKTKMSTGSTTGTAKWLSKVSDGAFTPIEADNIMRGVFGGSTKDTVSLADTALKNVGAISEKEATSSNPFERLKKRYTQAYGKSDGVRFYDKLADLRGTIKNEKARKAFDALHTKDEANGPLGSSIRATTYLGLPEVMEADRKLDQWSQTQGKPGNPLWKLGDQQRKKVLFYRASKLARETDQDYTKDGTSLFVSLGLDQPWYDNFMNDTDKFYAKVTKNKGSEKQYSTFSGTQKPKASPALQKKMDYYFTLPSGTGARTAFLQANPAILKYWDTKDQFANEERATFGLAPLGDKYKGGYSKGSSSGSGRSRGRGRSKSTPIGNIDQYMAGPAAPKTATLVKYSPPTVGKPKAPTFKKTPLRKSNIPKLSPKIRVKKGIV